VHTSALESCVHINNEKITSPVWGNFDCGYAVVCWRETTRIKTPTVGWYPDILAVARIHGHAGKTRMIWVDPDPRLVVHDRRPECRLWTLHGYSECGIPEPGRGQVWLGEATADG